MINAKEAHEKAEKYDKDNSIKYAKQTCLKCEQGILQAIEEGLFSKYFCWSTIYNLNYEIITKYLIEYFSPLGYTIDINKTDGYFYVRISW